jgi:hypothetical protein
MSELLYLSHNQLKIHPKNIRIYYPPKEVEAMARSLLATGRGGRAGNVQALLVVRIEDEHPSEVAQEFYYVIDGNLRLTAGRTLGESCPPFKCEPIAAGQAEQLLMMTTTGVHFPKDPISEGRHYRRLVEEEGFTIKAIADETGLSVSTIGSRLACLGLDEEIQEIMMRKELPADVRLVRALLSIPDPASRVATARYYVGRDVAIGTMIHRIRNVALRAHQVNGSGAQYREKLEKAQRAYQARAEARAANGSGYGLDEEAARLIWRLAGEFLCEGCKLSGLSAECYLCPGPQEFIEHVVELTETRLPEPEAVTEPRPDEVAHLSS